MKHQLSGSHDALQMIGSQKRPQRQPVGSGPCGSRQRLETGRSGWHARQQSGRPDGLRLGFTRTPLYSLVFLCRAVGGELAAHPLETSDVGWFARDALPTPLAGFDQWGDMAFAAITGSPRAILFDEPRDPPWHHDESS